MSPRTPLVGPAQLRWDLADEPAPSSLFHEVQRKVGRGEFRGMEFLHVEAKRILNEVKGSGPGNPGGLPFRWTVNPYRGCSHACSYCLSGDTPVLMADGTERPIADLQAGDRIYGTERRGSCRGYVPTVVLDHWQTEKEAWRVTLADGTQLVASADHRFLTERGWKHVAPAEGPGQRPFLTSNDSMLGAGAPADDPKHYEDDRRGYLCGMSRGDGNLATYTYEGRRPKPEIAMKGHADLRVVAVERTGIIIPMFDITTGTGDFIANGVISHNCFARPTHEYLGLDAGADFEQRVVVKVNAVERLRAELNPARWAGELVAMGTNTDPYQRCEGKYRLTRGLVRTLIDAGNPFSILTKSTLLLRDLDLLTEAAERGLARVSLSIGTVDEAVWRATEPGTPAPAQRLRAVAQLRDAGVPCGVLIAPILPGLSDSPEQLTAIGTAAVEAGAISIGHVVLHLRHPETRRVYLERLAATHPELVAGTERRYPGTSAPKAERDRIAATLRAAIESAGGHLGAMEPPLPASPVAVRRTRDQGSDPAAQLAFPI